MTNVDSLAAHARQAWSRTATIGLAWLALLLPASGAAADYDSRYYVMPMASYVFADDERHTDDGYGAALAVGRRLTEYMAVELSASYLDYGDVDPEESGLLCGGLGVACPDGGDFDLYGGGLGLNLYPFAGNLYLHLQALAGNHGHYSGGLGYEMGSFGNMSFVVEALYQSAADVEEPRINLGLKLPFGAATAVAAAAPPAPEPMPEPEPEPVRVVEAPCAITGPDGPVDLSGCEQDDTIVLEGVNFAVDSTEFDESARRTLERVAEALVVERPDLKVEIRGHTDDSASEAYNDDLSSRRAKAVKQRLVSLGVAEGRMSVRGFGELQPIDDNDTAEGRAANRRAELHVVEEGGPEKDPPEADTSAGTPEEDASSDTSADAVTSDSTVTIENFEFSPEALTVPVGTTVTWVNADRRAHIVAFEDTESPELSTGDSYERTFEASGSYEYSCGIHPSMTGRVVVSPSD